MFCLLVVFFHSESLKNEVCILDMQKMYLWMVSRRVFKSHVIFLASVEAAQEWLHCHSTPL